MQVIIARSKGNVNDRFLLLGVWEAAQARKARNRTNAKGNRKSQYLVGRRVICGRCGYKMCGTSAKAPKGRPRYRYYCCPGHFKHECIRTCSMPSFRAPDVDAAVWEWIREKVFDQDELARGLEKQRAAQDDELAPVRERVKALDGQLAEQRAQLERLLDLYLAGEFPKEILTERKSRLERTISALEEERDALVLRLETEALTKQEIQTLQHFVAQIAEGWSEAEDTFETRRHVIDLIDLQATLLMDEDGVRRVHAHGRLGSGTFRIAPKNTHGHNAQILFALTARLVIPGSGVYAV